MVTYNVIIMIDYKTGFYKFRDRVIHFNLLSYKLITILCIWLMICFMVVSVMGSYGLDIANKDREQKYHDGLISEIEYNNWHYILMPLAPFIFDTMVLLTFAAMLAPIFIILYLYKKEKLA
jgi:hypothetical protein